MRTELQTDIGPVAFGYAPAGNGLPRTGRRNGSAMVEGTVLQIGAGWLPEQDGGLNRVYYDLLRHLPAAGVSPVGLVMGSPAVSEESGGAVLPFAPIKSPLASRWAGLRGLARRVLREHHVPLVVSHFALYAFPVLDLIGDRPHVIHFQGPWAWESKVEGDSPVTVMLKRRLEKTVYARGDRFIVLSEAFRDVLHEHYGVPLDRISIVPCGVEADKFETPLSREQAREQLGWPKDRPILFAIRRLVNRMGLEDLIGAMREVRRRSPDALLMIAGRGPLAPKLAEEVQAHGLQDHVRLLGFLPEDDLPLAYRAADLTVVPTVALEGMGCITLESMASGTPVMVTPVGGLPEAVRGLSADLILPAHGEEALAEGISAALAGEIPLPSDEACRRYIREHFDWPIIARRVGEVYRDAI